MFKKVIVATGLAIVVGIATGHNILISSALAAPEDCDYTDADANGGWGWDPVDNMSCAPLGSDITPVSNVGPPGPQGPAGPSALTIGGNIGVVAITGTDVNGTGRDQARVAPGESFTVNFDYTIVASPGCPSCIDQIQVGIVSRDGAGSPQDCAYSGVAGIAGVTDAGSVTLTAPDSTGTYYIAFDRSQHFSCDQANSGGGFWNGTPDVNKFIGGISVF